LGAGGRSLLEALDAWCAAAQKALPAMLGAPDVDEAIATQTAGYRARVQHLLNLIENATPYEGETP